MMRADKGDDFIGNYFSELNKSDVGVSVIARLKSTRLKKKVLKKFNNDEVIVDLCNRVTESEFPVVLTTFWAIGFDSDSKKIIWKQFVQSPGAEKSW